MSNHITLVPAHGRDYTSAAAVKKDWSLGKDFVVADLFNKYDGKPANREDLAGYTVNIRYNKNRKVCTIKN